MATAERLGKYELVRHLASGGMARVFLARMTGVGGFERHLVLKTVRPERSEDSTFVCMFLDEARLVATLHHQHVAQVYEVGVADDGTYFLAMEYLHGETLRAVLERARDRKLRLPYDFGLTVVGAATSGLHHAHERRGVDGKKLGIVHRDVTPSNIIGGYDGSVKLIDFGIAKALERATQTQTGFIKGKAGYMAPEQALGEPVDRRADVFSLGVVLYELTTQTRAFPAASELEVAHRIVRGEVRPPSQVVPGFPPILEDVIMTALARDPDDRFPDTDLMGRAVTAAADLLGVTQRPTAVSQVITQLFGRRPEPWLLGGQTNVEDPIEITPDTASLLERPAHLALEAPSGRGTLAGPYGRAAVAEPPVGRAVPVRARAASEARRMSSFPGPPTPTAPRRSGTTEVSRVGDHDDDDDDDDDDGMPTVRYLSLEPHEITVEPAPPRTLPTGTIPPPRPRTGGHSVPPLPLVSRPRMSLPPGMSPLAADPGPPAPLVVTPLTAPLRAPLTPIPAAPVLPVGAPAPRGRTSIETMERRSRAWVEPTFQVIALRAERRRWARPVAVGALCAGALCAGAVIALVLTLADRDSESAATPRRTPTPPGAVTITPPPPAPVPPPSPPPPTVMVTLRVNTDPPGATVLLDGRRLGPAPVTIDVPREAREVKLKARKRGYLPRSIMIPLGTDGTWTIHLPSDD